MKHDRKVRRHGGRYETPQRAKVAIVQRSVHSKEGKGARQVHEDLNLRPALADVGVFDGGHPPYRRSARAGGVSPPLPTTLPSLPAHGISTAASKPGRRRQCGPPAARPA